MLKRKLATSFSRDIFMAGLAKIPAINVTAISGP
jgi:hypothetical protein